MDDRVKLTMGGDEGVPHKEDEPGVPTWLWPLYVGLIIWAVYYVIRFFSDG